MQPQVYQQPQQQKFNDNASQNSRRSKGSVNSNRSKMSNINSSPMKKLGNIINNKLKESNDVILSSSYDSTMSDSDDETYVSQKKIKITKNSNDTYLEYIRDSILIIIIYVILSQDFLQRAIISYIPQIANGGIISHTIYGVIHAIIYIIFKIAIS
jgi:hypothetical protein